MLGLRERHGRLSIYRIDFSIAESLAHGLLHSSLQCLLFRERLRSLMPLLRVKYKDFETSFRLGQAEKEAASLPPTAPLPEARPTPEEKTKFENLAELSPRAAILEARLDVEEALRLYAGAVDHEVAKTQTFLPLMRLLRLKASLIRSRHLCLMISVSLGITPHTAQTRFLRKTKLYDIGPFPSKSSIGFFPNLVIHRRWGRRFTLDQHKLRNLPI